MNAASIPHRRAALRLAGVPGADVRLQLATVLRYEDIYTDEPMHYDAHTRLAPSPRIVRSYPMDEFLFMPKARTLYGRAQSGSPSWTLSNACKPKDARKSIQVPAFASH